MTHFKNCCWARWVRYNWESHSNLNKFKSWARGFQFSLALKVWKLAYWRHFMPERQCAMLISRPLFYQIHKKKHQDRHTLWNEGTLTSGKLHILVHDQYVFYFFSDPSPYQNTWLITNYVQDSIWMQCFCSIENREFFKVKRPWESLVLKKDTSRWTFFFLKAKLIMFQLSSAPKSQIKAAEAGIPSSWLRKPALRLPTGPERWHNSVWTWSVKCILAISLPGSVHSLTGCKLAPRTFILCPWGTREVKSAIGYGP